MLLDGYPRTMPQMEAFLDLCAEKGRQVIWLNFELDDETTIARMMSRARVGEDENVMKTRLQEYYQHTHPLVERFAQAFPLYTIDASPSIETVRIKVGGYLS
jgi:adenylate kinase family enzyme